MRAAADSDGHRIFVNPWDGAGDGVLAEVPEQLTFERRRVSADAGQARLEPQADGTFKTGGVLFTGTYGRLRAAVQAPDGSLYLSTDNGTDRIIRVTPTP